MIFRIEGQKDDVRTVSIDMDDDDVNLRVDGKIILFIDENGFVHIADRFTLAEPVTNPVGQVQ